MAESPTSNFGVPSKLAASRHTSPPDIADFYVERHQHVYDAIRRGYTDGAAVSPVSIANELRRNGHGEVTEAELHELHQEAMATFAAAHVAEYATLGAGSG